MTLFGIFFAKPVWLWAAATLPIVYLLSRFFMGRRRRRLESFSRPELWKSIIPELDWGLARRKFLLWCFAAAFLLLALARPQWGEREETLKTTGLDVMLVLDVSRSMEVEDVVPSRLAKSRKFLRNLLERIQGDRAGLVLYAGSAHLQSPLTTDLSYIRELTDEATPNSVTNQGTDIGAALEVAVRALDRGAEQLKRESDSVPTSRVIILLSDGEDHEAQIQEGLAKVKDADLKLYVFGVGTEKGGPIPMRDESGQNFGFKRDRKGETVVSRAGLIGLQKLAEGAAGRYWTMSDSEMEIGDLVTELDALARGELAEKKISIKEERFQIFLAIGLFFFLAELFTSLRRPALGRKLAVIFWALFAIGSRDVRADSAPSFRAYRENEAAIRAFQEDRIPEAKQGFGRAQVEAPLSPDLSFNQGVLQLREGHLDEAISGFERAQKAATADGNHGLAARSLYNEAIAQTQKKNAAGAVDAYVRALESNQKQSDPELEARIRKNLELLTQAPPPPQNKESKDDKSDPKKQDEKKDGQKDEKDSEKDGKPKDSKDGQDPEKEKEKKDAGGESPKEDPGKDQSPKKWKREFKSEKLSPEDAERVMSELTRREKELKEKLERQKGRPQSLEKDW